MDMTAVPRPIDPEALIEMADGIVIRAGETLHTLNVTGREIISLFDGSCSIADIIAEMEQRYPDDDAVKPAVESFLTDLDKLNLLTSAS